MSESSRNILLVTSAAPNQTPFSTREKRPPIGIGFLIAVLEKAGHTVFFADNYLHNSDVPDLSYLIQNNIHMVGIYINTICLRHSLAVIHRLEYYRQAGKWKGIIVAGGPHTTVAPDTIPAFVDYVVQGEGEEAIVAIADGTATDRIVRFPRIEDLDVLPRPAWDRFAPLPYNWESTFFREKPVFSMNTSRGCPFKCSFCSVCSIWGRKYTMFSAERIVDDIEYLIKTHGAAGIYFREDNFTLNKRRLERFCNLLMEKNLTIPWVCETRVNTLTRDLVSLMAKSGARGFYFGVESGSQRILDFMEKDITLHEIRQAFSWCQEFNIATAASIVVGIPTETQEELRETRQLLAEIKPTVTWFNVFTGIPTSTLYRYTIDNKLYEFIDDRGLVYLKGHDTRTSAFYGRQWDADVPVKFDARGRVVNPLISVIMSVHNGERFLDEAIRSVLAQTVPSFEFIIVDDASTDGTASIIRQHDDRRIRMITNHEQLGLTASLIKAIGEAEGTFIARMDADDRSLPHRFALQMRYMDTHPECAMVGSSFYKLDPAGTILGIVNVLTDELQLKDELLRQNWFCHGSSFMRKAAYDATGGYRADFTCAQDYDLWLRMSEKYVLGNIEEPLYAWRSTPECISSARAGEQKAFADRAREEAQSRRSGNVKITAEWPLISIIVPTYNRPHILGTTLQSILNQTYPHIETVVVNDAGAPAEDVVHHLNKNGTIHYIRHAKNCGLAAARNTGIRMAKGEYVGYLDDDDIYYPDHVATLVQFLTGNNAQVAYSDALMAIQECVNGIWQTKERTLLYSVDFNYDLIFIKNLFPVLCIMHEKKCIDVTGGFDETLRTHEDWDLWLRMSRRFTMHHIKKVTAEYLVRRNAADQMTTNPSSDYNRTRKIIFERYAPLIKNRPDLIKLQETELISNDPVKRQELLLQRLGAFVKTTGDLIEQGELVKALEYYDLHRREIPEGIPELDRLDELMEKVRGKHAAAAG